MKKNIRTVIWVAAVLAAAAAVAFFSGTRKRNSFGYETAIVSRMDISNFITATGTIEPVTEVEVGTQVSGIIDRIFVDYNSVVKEGQIIAEMDKVTLESELESAQAAYDGNMAEYEYQKKNFERNSVLHGKRLISDIDYEQAEYSYEMARSSFNSSKAALDKAERNLSYATISSPIDGIVIDKAVEEGQTVAAGFETPTLFTIAADLTKMQVVADVDEADIGGVKVGQRASFTVDAYPDDTFEGTVKQIRLGSSSSGTSSTSSSSESVVTYEVVISADNPELKLLPRLTANIFIYTRDCRDVLGIPVRALKFKPESPFVDDSYEIRDCEGDFKVWTLDGNIFTAHAVGTGTSDGSSIEITEGVQEGMRIVTGAVLAGEARSELQSQQVERSPFAPGPPESREKRK